MKLYTIFKIAFSRKKIMYAGDQHNNGVAHIVYTITMFAMEKWRRANSDNNIIGFRHLCCARFYKYYFRYNYESTRVFKLRVHDETRYTGGVELLNVISSCCCSLFCHNVQRKHKLTDQLRDRQNASYPLHYSIELVIIIYYISRSCVNNVDK